MIGAGQVADDLRRGFGASLEDILIAALVALPFSGTLAIFLGALGLPGEIGVVVAGLAQGVGTFWIAGALRRGQDH
jgi:Kef-type K+ transport system membrane component KefB